MRFHACIVFGRQNMFFLILSTIVVGLITSVFVIHLITSRRIAKIVEHFPAPPSWPILGNLFVFLGKSPPEIFTKLVSLHTELGPNLLTFGILNFVTLNITDPKDVEKVMVAKSTQSKASTYDYFRCWLGNGLLVSSGRDWFAQRKIITPAFHFNILDDFISVFSKQTDKMIELLRPHADGGHFNIYNHVTLCALDIICESAMGTDIKAQQNPDQEYVRAVKRMSAYIFDRFFMALAQYEMIFNLTPTARKQKQELKILHDFTDAVIVTRKQQLQSTPSATLATPNNNDDVGKPKLTFLDLLLSSSLDGRPLTNAEIREQVDTFMFEGHDTTTSAISFAIYHLSQNQAVQERAYQEVVEILGGQSQSLSHANLQDMKYLEMVIKETLRVHPSVPIIGRILSEDTELGGVMVPKGIDIGVQIYAIHRNPDVFPNPDRFDPERFTENFELRKNPYEYIPFSAGPRNCIGQRFAMLEMKATLCKLLLNYKILPDVMGKEIPVKMDLVLRPVDGVFVKLETRL